MICVPGWGGLHRFHGWRGSAQALRAELAAHASSCGFCLEFLTHGYWKDQARIEQLAMARPAQITISVDGLARAFEDPGPRGFFRAHQPDHRDAGAHQERGSQPALPDSAEDGHHGAEPRRVGRGGPIRYSPGLAVFYQPIEQNYNTAENPKWFVTSPTWLVTRGGCRAVCN